MPQVTLALLSIALSYFAPPCLLLQTTLLSLPIAPSYFALSDYLVVE